MLSLSRLPLSNSKKLTVSFRKSGTMFVSTTLIAVRFERAMQHGLARENDSFATLSNDDAVPLSKVVSDEDDYPSRLGKATREQKWGLCEQNEHCL